MSLMSLSSRRQCSGYGILEAGIPFLLAEIPFLLARFRLPQEPGRLVLYLGAESGEVSMLRQNSLVGIKYLRIQAKCDKLAAAN